MSEVDEKEINRGIADYCGLETDGEVMGSAICVVRNRDGEPNYITAYTRSLDSLVPVWEKLGLYPCFTHRRCLNSEIFTVNGYVCELFNVDGDAISCESEKTIQLAAALSTYKAIKALEGRGE